LNPFEVNVNPTHKYSNKTSNKHPTKKEKMSQAMGVLYRTFAAVIDWFEIDHQSIEAAEENKTTYCGNGH
jgi:hypothetical protein